MKMYKYEGRFKAGFKLHCYCTSVAQAVILLTADAIRQGLDAQLDTLVTEEGYGYVFEGDIFKSVWDLLESKGFENNHTNDKNEKV